MEIERLILINFGQRIQTLLAGFTQRGQELIIRIVQGKDNEEYLHMDYNKKKSSSGTIFLDHGCDKSFISDNNIIYGHHMKNGTMFAKLLKFREESFLKKHHVIILYTPKKTMHLKVSVLMRMKHRIRCRSHLQMKRRRKNITQRFGDE